MKKLIASLLAATMLAGTASAQVLGSYPYTLTNGSLADANQVMSNFNYITTQVNANTCTLSGCTFTGSVYGTSLSLSSTLGVTGATTLTGLLTANSGVVASNWTLNGSNSLYIYDAGSNILGFRSGTAGSPKYASLDASGNFNVLSGNLTVAGNTSLSGTLGVNGTISANSGMVLNGNVTGSSNSSIYTLAGGGVYTNGGAIALYGSSASGLPGTIQFISGAGGTNVGVGSFASNGTFNVVNNATIGGTLGATGAFTASNGITLAGGIGISFPNSVYVYEDTSGAGPGDLVIRTYDQVSTNYYYSFGKSGTLSIPALSMTGNASVGGALNVAGAISGPGTGLTGTAASLNIGGNAATATTATNVSGGSVSATSGTFSSAVSASSFSGAGTGLTGTASSLSIGGNAATATNATTATNVSGGGTVSASTITAAGSVTAGSFAGAALASAAQTLTGSSTTQAITPGGFAGNSSLGVSGYYKLPGGLIEQWLTTGNIGTSTTVSYPTSCASAVLSIQATAIYGGTPEAINVVTSSVGLTSAQFSINGVAAPAYVRILCI